MLGNLLTALVPRGADRNRQIVQIQPICRYLQFKLPKSKSSPPPPPPFNFARLDIADGDDGDGDEGRGEGCG